MIHRTWADQWDAASPSDNSLMATLRFNERAQTSLAIGEHGAAGRQVLARSVSDHTRPVTGSRCDLGMDWVAIPTSGRASDALNSFRMLWVRVSTPMSLLISAGRPTKAIHPYGLFVLAKPWLTHHLAQKIFRLSFRELMRSLVRSYRSPPSAPTFSIAMNCCHPLATPRQRRQNLPSSRFV
jgi:hypothetical protein